MNLFTTRIELGPFRIRVERKRLEKRSVSVTIASPLFRDISSGTHIDVRRDIALHSGVRVDEPSAADIAPGFEYLVFDEVLQLGEPVLELVSHEQARKPCADGDHAELSRRKGEFIMHGYGILGD